MPRSIVLLRLNFSGIVGIAPPVANDYGPFAAVVDAGQGNLAAQGVGLNGGGRRERRRRRQRRDAPRRGLAIEKHGRYFGDPLKLALDVYSFYTCHTCEQPFFGGKRDCEGNAAADNTPAEELVCPGCAQLSNLACSDPSHAEPVQILCRALF